MNRWQPIVDQIEKLAAIDRCCDVLGANRGSEEIAFSYQFDPVVPMDEIEKHEARLGARLPDELKAFYLSVGNGGPGPDGGILPIASLESYRADEPWLGLDHYNDPANWDYENTIAGIIMVMGRYYAYENVVVVNGPELGAVMAYDPDNFLYREADNLIMIYQDWLDKQLASFDHIQSIMRETQKLDDIVHQLDEQWGADAGNSLTRIASMLGFQYSYHPQALGALSKKVDTEGNYSYTIRAEVCEIFEPLIVQWVKSLPS